MDNQPLVSVGIPSYNRPEGLRRTLECITQQTYWNLEIIISDNCSPNPEEEMVANEFIKKDSRVRYFRQISNIGAANNFKFVLECAKGEYFMWAADDDEWDKKFVEFCLKNIGDHTSIMTGFKIKNKVNNSENQINIPFLSNTLSIYNNLIRFLPDLRSSLFFGVHKRNSINYFLDDDFFDYYDCYFIIKQIISGGFITYPNVYYYYAGIDSEGYVPKPHKNKRGKLFEYYPFFFKSAKVIIKTQDLSLKQKIRLINKLLNVIINQFCTYEALYRPYQVRTVKFFSFFFNWILKTAKKLVYKNELKNFHINDKPLGKYSFSQCGEDLIVNYVFSLREIHNPSYLDIGANDPFYLSNTAFFYLNGSRGINIEPNPALIENIKIARPEDINLNIGIAESESALDFYVINDPTLSSFSTEECDKFIATGKYFIIDSIKIKVTTIQRVLDEYNKGVFPDFLTIDAEGMDLGILKTIDYANNAPKVICVEAADYSPIGAGERRTELIDFLVTNGYFEYANTNLNAIMVRRDFWFK
jgi:FkbM family methyltransferase